MPRTSWDHWDHEFTGHIYACGHRRVLSDRSEVARFVLEGPPPER
jgi:hypothetical protein